MPKLSHKARKRWSIFVLLVGIPVYAVVAVTVVEMFDRPHFLLEALIYLVLGVVWALPLRFVFLGVGREDPDAPRD
ncbi:DUF2842 domain-containing protein [Rhodobaculum claviforme]|uniref:DUF2842 domain-containing protein n=1 Tax=Rhodobaculum claviforme TaxID=1549854 RepID=A0A934TGY2_9RHOB|nr:DUF2842 domain-containing protein [Rhodobaculum claviforme]MBK5926194.1 hypothetical protein [Rhodobaculum claviforme]